MKRFLQPIGQANSLFFLIFIIVGMPIALIAIGTTIAGHLAH